MIRFSNHTLALALTTSAIGLWSLTACQDDDEWTTDVDTSQEGLPATITIGLHVSDMDERTRSIVDEDACNYCNNVWVGIYLADGGECVSNRVYMTDDQNETVGSQYELPNLTVVTQSGAAHIVAVANVDNEDATASPSDTTVVSLRTALANATTWEKFKQVCVHKSETGATSITTGTLMMAGHYIGSDAETLVDGIPVVQVQPGENKLKGAIYLRRLTSYNKVKISAGENITMSLQTWKVGNIPTDSYIFEQEGNAGTLTPAERKPYAASAGSHIFALADESTSDHKIYEFEFYQYENKHTACNYTALGENDYVGISPTGLYYDREREYKNADGTNSGIYKSLVSDKTDDAQLASSNASYFVFTAQLDYYIDDTDDNRAYPGQATPVAYDATKKQIHRTAQASYTVHLGYCEDKENDLPTLATAKDFNCRRNTKYTYNIQVLGANKLVVEAKKEGEEQPGAEGTVRDDYSDYIAMDSHYCVFNIALTNKERSQIKYRIYAPYNNQTYTFNSVDYKEAWEQNQLYNWVKFKPATARDVLTRYKENPNDTANFLSLEDLLHVKEHPWGTWSIDDNGQVTATNEDTDPNSTTVHYYTVFVDEYVYHHGDGKTVKEDETDGVESLWYTYVNQDDRVVELFDNTNRSTDQESDYTFCKYTFAQKSIQTFYKHQGGEHVLGVEHTDENYCLNYRWNYVHPQGNAAYDTEHERSVNSADNGRFNNWKYITQRRDNDGEHDLDWDKYVQWTQPDYIPGGTSSSTKISHEAMLYPVAMMGDVCSSNSVGQDPTPGFGYNYVNAACMNRNRDLDGDGKISQDELRWYLPTSNTYIQIGLGQSEMPDPLIKLLEHPKDEFKNKNKNNYHYATSNCQYVWAEELISVGDRANGYDASQWCYTVRCVRNLGANPATPADSAKNEIANAYTHNSVTRTIYMNRYTDVSLRSYNGSYIPAHDIGSEESRPYKAFQYAKGWCKNITDTGILSAGGDGTLSWVNADNEGTKALRWAQSLAHNGLCGQYTEEAGSADKGTWRVPTFKEMSLLYTEGLMGGEAQLSCSYNHFLTDNNGYSSSTWEHKFLGYNNEWNRKVLAMDIMERLSGSIHIRCVRDIQQ